MSGKPKLIVMLSRFPFPLEKGDKLRAYYQIIEFSKSYDIKLICISEHVVSEQDEKELHRFCSEIHIFILPKWRSLIGAFLSLTGSKPLQVGYFYSLKIKRKINKILEKENPDHLFCQLIRASEYVKDFHSCSKTIDYMDAFSMGVKRRIKMQPFYQRWLFRLESKRLENYEREIYDYFEIHTIISEQDARLLGSTPNQKVYCVANGVSDFFLQAPKNNQPEFDLVFIGNLNYPPNVEAVKFIVNEILPISKKKGFNWTFLAAGADPTNELKEIFVQSNNITLQSNIKDIRDAYGNGKAFVAPMKIGTGLQNKLLEAMAMGIPCVTTQLANNALNAKIDQEILIAETPEEFVIKIDQILNSPTGSELANRSRNFISENYNWANLNRELIDRMQKA